MAVKPDTTRPELDATSYTSRRSRSPRQTKNIQIPTPSQKHPAPVLKPGPLSRPLTDTLTPPPTLILTPTRTPTPTPNPTPTTTPSPTPTTTPFAARMLIHAPSVAICWTTYEMIKHTLLRFHLFE